MNYQNFTVDELVEHFRPLTYHALWQALQRFKADEQLLQKLKIVQVLFKEEKKQQRKDEKNLERPNSYSMWLGMKTRCTNPNLHVERPTYESCTFSEEFSDFSTFHKWCTKQKGYGEKDKLGKPWQLDKDLILIGNKIYSPETCVFLPQEINSFIIVRNKTSTLPLGVTSVSGKFQSACSDNYLGLYSTPGEAFSAYRTFKEAQAKILAFQYRSKLDTKAFEALLNYNIQERSFQF